MIKAEEIQLEKLEAIGHGPDARGDIAVQCEVTARYSETIAEPLARLRMVVVDESGEWPLAACESPLLQQGGASEHGRLTLKCGLRTAVPAAIDVNDLGVRPILLVYSVPWTSVCDVVLPPVGRRQDESGTACGDLQVSRWWVSIRSVLGGFTEYEVGACIENRGSETLALAAVRMVLEDPSRRVLWSAVCAAEGIGPGEERVLSGRISVAGGPELRNTNRITLSAGAVRAPVLVPLAVWEVEMSAEPESSLSTRRAGVTPAGFH